MSGGGGGGNTTTTQKADPWSGVQPYLLDAYSRLSQMYAPGQGPQYYPGQQVADLNAYQQAGINGINAAVPAINQMGNQASSLATNMGWYGQNAAANGLSASSTAADRLNAIGNSTITADGIVNQQQAAANLLNQGNANATAGGSAMQQYMNQLGANGANQLGTGMSGATNAINGLQAAGDFNNNPAYQAALQSAINPLTQQFQEQVLPGLKSGAQDAGQFGGSRQGIAEGIASRGYLDAVANTTANMGNAAYAQGLQAQANAGSLSNQLVGQGNQNLQAAGSLGSTLSAQGLQGQTNAGQLGYGLTGQGLQALQGAGALGSSLYGNGSQAMGQVAALTPGLQQAAMAGGNAQLGLGSLLQGQNQAQIDAQMNQWNYNQNLPYTMMSDYLSMLQGQAGGQTVSSQSGGGGSRLAGGLGGAASGAALGTAFAPGIGTGIGAGLGALYGLFM